MILHLQHVWFHVKSVGQVWLMANVQKGNRSSSVLPLNCKKNACKNMCFHFLSFSLSFSLVLSTSLFCSLSLALKLKRKLPTPSKCDRAALNQGHKAVGEHFDINHNLRKVGEEFPCEMRASYGNENLGVGFGSINLAYIQAHRAAMRFWIILGQMPWSPNAEVQGSQIGDEGLGSIRVLSARSLPYHLRPRGGVNES